MKLTTNKTALHEALQIALAVTPGRATLPILDTIYLEAIDGRVLVKSTDLDMHIGTGFPCEAEKEGAICLPSKRLANLIRELPTESVSLEVRDNIATISSGRLNTRLHGLPASEFPSADSEDFTDELTLNATDFAASLRRTAFAASNDEARYILNGVLLAGGDTPILLGTDGRRLSKAQVDAQIPETIAAIIPNKAIPAILKIIGDSPVTLEIGQSFAAIHGENAILKTRLIAGTFPDWRQVMPKNLPRSVELDRETLLSAVRRVGLLANDKVSSITITFSRNEITISAKSPDIGEATELIETSCDIQAEVTLNTHYLLQALQNASDDTLQWRMDDETSPVMLEAGSWQYVLMPMRKG